MATRPSRPSRSSREVSSAYFRLRACLKKGGPGYQPVLLGNLPSGREGGLRCSTSAGWANGAPAPSSGLVARRHRQVACATYHRFFRPALIGGISIVPMLGVAWTSVVQGLKTLD